MASGGPAKRPYPSVWWFIGGGAVVVSIVFTLMSKHGGPSEESVALAAIRPGHVFAPGALPNTQFADRTWRVESWSVVAAQQPLRPGGDRCDAFGGVVRDAKKDSTDPNAIFTALGIVCNGRVMDMPAPQNGSRVWLTPLWVNPLDSSRPWTAESKIEIRFVEAVAPGESVVWTSSTLVTKTDKGVVQVLSYEQAFRDNGSNVLLRPLATVGLEANTIRVEENAAALASYRCAFEGDRFPKTFRCTSSAKNVAAQWNAQRLEWRVPD